MLGKTEGRRGQWRMRGFDDITLIAESKKKTKEPPDESERESEKVGLKFNIQKT